jgi:hypothetical protein
MNVGFVARSNWSLFFVLSDIPPQTQGFQTRTLRKTNRKNDARPQLRMIPTFSGFTGFFMFPDRLVYWVPALRGILASRLSTVLFFTVFDNCMDNWELYDHVAALVSHQGDAATVSRTIPPTVTFAL